MTKKMVLASLKQRIESYLKKPSVSSVFNDGYRLAFQDVLVMLEDYD